MVMNCCYCGKTKNEGTNGGRTFYQLPLNQPRLLECWLSNMRLGPNFKPLRHMRLCSDHFSKESLQKIGVQVQLLEGSIPTLFGMYKSACVYCSAVKTQGDHRTFHKFPIRNSILLQKWLAGIRKKNYIPTESSRLCSNHFEKTCFRSSGYGDSLRLTTNAIPTIFRAISPEEIPVVAEKRKHESSQELPAAKHFRLETAATETENSTVLPSVQKTSDTEQFIMNSDNDEKYARCSFSSAEGLVPGHALNEKPEGTCTPTWSKEPTTPNTAHRIHMTAHDHQYENTPRTTKKKLISSKKTIKRLQEVVRVHKQQVTRLKKKISSLHDIVSELRRTRALPDSGLACLDSIAQDDVSQFLKRYMKNQKKVSDKKTVAKKRQWKCQRRDPAVGISREKYPAALRSFAITLHFYSPKAYGFVRRKFCNALPDPATLRSWYSSIDAEPGFTTESFEALKIKVAEGQRAGKEVVVAFMFNEMGIKKGMQCSPNGTVRGYVDLGSNMEASDIVPLAKDALVLMAVSLDSSWKIPLGYFFITGIDSETNAGLVTEGLIRLHDIGVKVVSITLDGPSQHFATMRSLGATFDMPDPEPYFPHPSTGDKVFVLFDACHMLKLMRNCLSDRKVLKDSQGNSIEWRFVDALATLQQYKEGLRAGNRLRMAHVRFHKMKIKVALAADTLSSSVADSISFCNKKLGLPKFQGSEATVRFIQCIDRVFDFLNSRNLFAKGYKAPLRRSNESFWRPQISTEIEYLKGITDMEGRPMWSTPKYVAFVGLITGVMSVIGIFDIYVKPGGSQLMYLLTYKLSHDDLELFFCAVRSCGGWCPNPTCRQFLSAYKRLLIHHEVSAANGNAEAMDTTKILAVSSDASRRKKVDRYDPTVYDAIINLRVAKKYGLDEEDGHGSDSDEFLKEFLQFHRELPVTLSDFSKACVGNIGGWVVKKLVDERRPVVKCEKCRDALFQESQVVAEFDDNALVEAKTRGGLIFPSKSVVSICQRSEHLLRQALNENGGMTPQESNFPAVICSKVMNDLLQTPGALFPSLNEHIFDDAIEELSNHVYLLTKQICKTFIQLRLFAATNLATEAAVGQRCFTI